MLPLEKRKKNRWMPPTRRQRPHRGDDLSARPLVAHSHAPPAPPHPPPYAPPMGWTPRPDI